MPSTARSPARRVRRSVNAGTGGLCLHMDLPRTRLKNATGLAGCKMVPHGLEPRTADVYQLLALTS